MLYALSLSVTDTDGDFSTRHLPTFYLDSNVQGIVSEEHALEIGRNIVDPFGLYEVSGGVASNALTTDHTLSAYVPMPDATWRDD